MDWLTFAGRRGLAVATVAVALAAAVGFCACFRLAAAAFAESGESAAAESADTEAEADAEESVKIESPTLAKEVWEDSVEGWYASADAGWGEEVPFRLTATLPSNWEEFSYYYLAFHDTADESVVVDVESVAVALVDAETGASTDVTGAFAISYEECELTAACEDLKAVGAFAEAAYGDTIVLTYTATLDPETATTGTSDPARNFAYLIYTSKPTSNALGKTPEATTKLYSWKLRLEKLDAESGSALAGARFTVREEASGLYLDGAGGRSAEAVELACDSDGVLVLAGVDSGVYTVAETAAPEGYETLEAFSVTIGADAQTGSPELSVSAEAAGVEAGVEDASAGIVLVQVENEATPSAGTPDTPTDLVQTGVGLGAGGVALVVAVALAALGWFVLRGRGHDRARGHGPDDGAGA